MNEIGESFGEHLPQGGAPPLSAWRRWGAGLLFGLGVLLEISAGAIYHQHGMAVPAAEALSFTAIVFMLLAAVLLLTRMLKVHLPLYLACGFVAASSALSLLGSLPGWAAHPWFQDAMGMGRLLEDVLFVLGILGVFGVLLYLLADGYWTRVMLERQNAELRALAMDHDAALRTQEMHTAQLQRLATAIEAAAEAIVITDTDACIEYCNPAFAEMSGYLPGEVLGRKTSILNSKKHGPAHYEELWREILAGRVWEGRFLNRRKDGTLFETDATIAPVRDDKGAITHFVSVQRDITRELSLEKQVQHAQRMEAMGTLAGGIAHDFRNILSLVLGHCEMALRGLPEDDPTHRHISQIHKAGARASDLVGQFLAFGRPMERKRMSIQPGLMVGEAARFLRTTLPPTLRMAVDIDKQAGVIFADATEIHQIAMNLCTNAVQAMPHGNGLLEISLHRHEVDHPAPCLLGRLTPGPYLVLTVSDDGVGMDPEMTKRIFEPFFTTKEEHEGTGLGLSSVRTIVEQCQGAVQVDTQPGEGTTFRVYFPAAKGGPLQETAPLEKAPRGQGECLLVVDDSDSIVRVSAQLLRAVGYEVMECTSSRQALEILRQEDGAINALITDNYMPEMTGIELARATRELHPGLPVLLMTGYTERLTEEQARDMGVSAYLAKPFTTHTLCTAVRRALEGG